ncbi:MAG: DSD1 family PLP-dependent enzyme [Gammaproteobacteria bacterium]|nr:DSD1 family PLP-dependent enzyme [Gammaproteobacteria bacterium]
MTSPPDDLRSLETPALLLDASRMEANIERMHAQARRLGVRLRPHLKTSKSVEVARRTLRQDIGPITVSTLKEADHFAEHGFTDILYAVGITPGKLDHALRLRARGVELGLVLDNVDAARAVVSAAESAGVRLSVLLEIDCDGHRSGLQPEGDELLAVADALRSHWVSVAGVMTHAGESYNCRTPESLCAMAEQERAAAVRAAQRLRDTGHAAPVVSVGSTPTALSAAQLDGVTELRAGVFVFFDLVMAGVGVCAVQDIALSVLTTVIGHQRDKGWTIVDAGWMALSRDRGTASQPVDQGYGLVCDVAGRVLPGLVMASANQEHGIVALRDGSTGAPPELPVGTLLRIVPNHACATGAQHAQYHVLDGRGRVTERWPRFSGW